MNDADREIAALLARNPELSVANPPQPRPMPDAARELLHRLRPMSVGLTLPYPPLVNRMYRISGKKIILTDAAKTYKLSVMLQVQHAGIAPFTGQVAVYIHLYRGRKCGDVDGPVKALLDSLNHLAWNDDSQVIELHVFRHDDKANPRAEVEIRQVGP